MSATGLPALDNTMGALYIGVIISMGLWGAGSVQMYYYYNRYWKDDWRLKTLVFVVWAFDTIHQALIIHASYLYLVTNYANPLFLGHLESTLLDMVMFTAFICLIVQSFFCMRIWRLSNKSYWMTGGCMAFVLTQFIATCVYFGKAIHFTDFTQLLGIKNLTRSINIVNALADACIAMALVYLLNRSRTGFKHSETIINRLIMFTINTGLLTGATAIVCLITNIVFPLTFIYICFYLMTSRLYMNSLLATLNSRKSILGGIDNNDGSNSVSMDRLRSRPVEINPAASSGKASNAHMLSIKVDTETTRDDGGKFQRRAGSDSDLESAYPNDKGAAF